MSVVGYDDGQQAWICKNSWGASWGLAGFFLIGYGQCGVDANMWSIEEFKRIQVEAPVGISCGLGVAGDQPYAYVADNDNNVWVNNWGNPEWQWRNTGAPTAAISRSLGATMSTNPYLFVLGVDGNVSVNSWGGSTFNWTSMSQPAYMTFNEPGGVTAVPGGDIYLFVVDGNAQIHVSNGAGESWQWGVVMPQPNSPVVCRAIGACNDGTHPYVFIEGMDANLYAIYLADSTWTWQSAGRPSETGIAESYGVVYSGCPYVFARGGDGHLYFCNWNSNTSQWCWQDLSTPPGCTLNGSCGVTADGDGPIAFVQCDDGNIWSTRTDGTAWQCQATPGGVKITGLIGATTLNGGPVAYVLGDDGNMWYTSCTPTWTWTNLGGSNKGILSN